MYAVERQHGWEEWKGTSWEVKEIGAARKAPACMGGWEYWVEWKGAEWEGFGGWEREGNISTGMRDEMKEAREHKYVHTTFEEWLRDKTKGGNARRHKRLMKYVKGEESECHGDGMWEDLWEEFQRYARSTNMRGARTEENVGAEPAHEEGGEEWKADAARTKYGGEKTRDEETGTKV